MGGCSSIRAAEPVAKSDKAAKRVVWVSGNPGAGKSFVGDYLQRYAGFFHIDGDEPMRSKVEAEKQLWANLT